MKTLRQEGRASMLQVGEGAGPVYVAEGVRVDLRGCLEDELAEFDDPQAVDGKSGSKDCWLVIHRL